MVFGGGVCTGPLIRFKCIPRPGSRRPPPRPSFHAACTAKYINGGRCAAPWYGLVPERGYVDGRDPSPVGVCLVAYFRSDGSAAARNYVLERTLNRRVIKLKPRRPPRRARSQYRVRNNNITDKSYYGRIKFLNIIVCKWPRN